MTQLGLSLQQKVGDTVLLAALAHIASGIQLQQRAPEVVEPEEPVPSADTAHEQTTNVTPIRPDIDPAATAVAAGNAATVANAASDAADDAAGAKKEEGG